jgi:predicted HTH domain antitoxin
MAQNVLTIEYSDDLLFRMGLSKEKFSAEAKLLLAAKLYELGRLSSGEAAKFAGKGRVEFLHELPGLGVTISNLRESDLDADLDFALNE